MKISFLAQRVQVSEILRHFFQLYSTQSRLVYNPTETILAILYSEVPHMLPAKYQPNRLGGSGEEVIWMIFTIYGHCGHLEFQIMTHFSLILCIHHIYAKYEISLKLAQIFIGNVIWNFFINGCHGNQSFSWKSNFHKNFMKNKLSSSKGSCIGNFASFFPTLPHPLKACLWSNRNDFS